MKSVPCPARFTDAPSVLSSPMSSLSTDAGGSVRTSTVTNGSFARGE